MSAPAGSSLFGATLPEEVPVSRLAGLYFFLLLASYYTLQPLRDELGLAGGVEKLPWLFLATMGTMLVANPLFSMLVSAFPRGRLIPLVYRFFLINLVIFYGLIGWGPASWHTVISQAFFLWVSVFNLFAVSVFWSFMADLFTHEQGKRLFGFIGAGGTLGEMAGSFLTVHLSQTLGNQHLLLVAILLLEGATQAAIRLDRLSRERRSETLEKPQETPPTSEKPTPSTASQGNTATRGIRLVLSSPYLLGICLFMLLYTFTSSFLYFEKATIVKAAFTDGNARTAFFGKINLGISTLTLFIQLFLTGRLLPWLGIGLSLALVPLLTLVGFIGLAQAPILLVLGVFEVARKAGNYAIARPAREILFTVVSRDEKYQAKNFIDTFVYRGGDTLAAGAFDLLLRMGFGLTALAWAGVPFAALWLLTGLWLGTRQQQLAETACQTRKDAL